VKNNVVFRPTVVVGLGGTGYGALLKLKKRFVDAYGSVPPIIRFLSIDTTENAEGTANPDAKSEGELDHNETYVLQVGSPASLVNGANPHIDEWWPPEIPTQAIIAGAGQVRARGRLALFAKAADYASEIMANTGAPAKLPIFIASLSGGGAARTGKKGRKKKSARKKK